MLKPGGRLIVADGFRRARPFSQDDERLLQSWLSGWTIPDIDTPNEFTAAMRDLSFSHIVFEDATEPIRPSMEHLYRSARLLVPPARVLFRLGLVSPTRLRNGEASYKCYEAFVRGLTLYGIVSAQKPMKP